MPGLTESTAASREGKKAWLVIGSNERGEKYFLATDDGIRVSTQFRR